MSPVDQALFNPDFIYKMRSGKVEAGTLEGLVEFLILHPAGEPSNSSLKRSGNIYAASFVDNDFDEAFFISHSAFTASHYLLVILIRRFNDETRTQPSERATIRTK
jgi:hypothetical protein